MTDQPVERFRATSGRVTGVIGLVLTLGVAAFGLVDRDSGISPSVVAGALVAAVLVWAALLRPRIWLTAHDLVLRNMLETVSIPLASIEEVAVGQVLAVRAGHKRFVSAAVGRNWRRSARTSQRASRGPSAGTGLSDAIEVLAANPGGGAHLDYLEARIRQRAEDERAARGIQRYSDEQVALAAESRREPAWLEIAALAATSLAFVVTLVV